jgi:hypothetical protein
VEQKVKVIALRPGARHPSRPRAGNFSRSARGEDASARPAGAGARREARGTRDRNNRNVRGAWVRLRPGKLCGASDFRRTWKIFLKQSRYGPYWTTTRTFAPLPGFSKIAGHNVRIWNVNTGDIDYTPSGSRIPKRWF